MTDLSQFDGLVKAQEEGLDVDIVHPATGDELGIKIRVAGIDSERFKKARQAIINKRIQSRSTKRQTAAELEEENLQSLAKCVISWQGLVVDDKALECSPENAVAVFKRFPFVREQIDAAVGDRAGFMQS